MILFLDTETTGLLKWGKAFNAPGQPRVVSIGGVAFSDTGDREVGSFYTIIRPEGFVIDNESYAAKLNGITQEVAMECGVPIKSALLIMDQLVYRARYVVFFNAQFDQFMLEGEAFLFSRTLQFKPERIRCAKIAYTNLCEIPSPTGHADFKWPKLEEAYRWMFGREPEAAHNAMNDARMTGWLTFAAMDQGMWDLEADRVIHPRHLPVDPQVAEAQPGSTSAPVSS